MGKYHETKHDAYNLKFKEHEVFKDQLVVVDETDTPYIWLNKKTGKVSFGGKYFYLYKEQQLLEVLLKFVYSTSNRLENEDLTTGQVIEASRLLNMFDNLKDDFKIEN